MIDQERERIRKERKEQNRREFDYAGEIGNALVGIAYLVMWSAFIVSGLSFICTMELKAGLVLAISAFTVIAVTIAEGS